MCNNAKISNIFHARILSIFWALPQFHYRSIVGRAFRSIFCSATATQKDAAAIPHAGLRWNWHLDFKRHFEGVDKKEVPISILQQIIVKLIDGTNISIDVKQLLADGMPDAEIEDMLDAKFSELDAYIQNVDFLIDIDKVVDAVQPETDKVLKGLWFVAY